MTDFKKMLEYQQLGISNKRLDNEYDKSGDKKKLDDTRRKYNEMQEKVTRGAVEAEKLIEDVNRAYEEHKAVLKEFEECNASIEAAETDEEKVKFLSKLEVLKYKMETLDRTVSNRVKRSEELVRSCAKAQDEKKEIKKKYDEIKKRLDAFKLQQAPKRDEIKKKMDAIAQEVTDKSLMEKYEELRSELTLPVIVQANIQGTDYSCYCGMGLSEAKKSILLEQKKCQCENCRRIIFVE